MKTLVSTILAIGVAALLSSCDGDSGGSSGGRGDFPTVSYARNATSERVECYNANSNVYTGGRQVCTWNCAYHNSRTPRMVQLTFDFALVCEDTGVDATTGEVTQTCTNEFALVDRTYAPCL